MVFPMTTRLYYHDSFLYDFDAEVLDVVHSPRPAIILDRTAFYPTSGGQVFDTGWITVRLTTPSSVSPKLRTPKTAGSCTISKLRRKTSNRASGVRGQIDAARRRDHMQQHSGQHVLSAAFIRLYNMPTVSFHMADDYCSIDLDTPSADQGTNRIGRAPGQ